MLRQESEDSPENGSGDTLLQRAAYWGLDKAIQKLLDTGADPSERDNRGETPLHKAVRRGHANAVRALLDSGADVDTLDGRGLTALHWVALNGRGDLAEMLLDAGARPSVRNQITGELTPLAMAKLMGYEELAQILGAHGAKY
jgi:ankyrin repeat protein